MCTTSLTNPSPSQHNFSRVSSCCQQQVYMNYLRPCLYLHFCLVFRQKKSCVQLAQLAGAITEPGDGSVFGEPSVSSSEGTKRKIPDSVVTKTVIPNAKRGKIANRAFKAGWLTSTPPTHTSSGVGRSWHERGRGNRGAIRGGGRWTPRWSRRGNYGRRPW
jgi:hypothetical protein